MITYAPTLDDALIERQATVTREQADAAYRLWLLLTEIRDDVLDLDRQAVTLVPRLDAAIARAMAIHQALKRA